MPLAQKLLVKTMQVDQEHQAWTISQPQNYTLFISANSLPARKSRPQNYSFNNYNFLASKFVVVKYC